jgi:molybdopterin-guanine dinucleotide biosynthesis protein A
MTVTAVVLCGGQSSRMGRDKAALPFGGETMLDRVVRLAGDVAGEVMVVAREGQAVPAGVTVVRDPVAGLGPLAGIAAGLGAITSDVAVVVACDMPLIRPAVLERLVASLGDHAMCVADVDGHPSVLCGVYRKDVAAVAQDLLQAGERRVTALLDRVTATRVDAATLRDIDPDLDTFFSCDTREAYQQALLRTGSAARRSPGA